MLENKYYTVLKKNSVLIFFMGILVPIILVILFELAKDPEMLKLLKFDPEHPTFFNMFLSSYTHEKWDHLFQNLQNYYLLIVLIFIFELFIFETNGKRLYIEIALIFLILPFVMTILYIFNHGKSALGISGINFGMNGYLLHCMYHYLKQNKNNLSILLENKSKIMKFWIFIVASVLSLKSLLDILSPNNVLAHSIGYSFGILTPFLVDFILAKYDNEN